MMQPWGHHYEIPDRSNNYGDGLYKEAEKILGLEYNYLAQTKRLSELFEISNRLLNLPWVHHREVASLKQIKEEAAARERQGERQVVLGKHHGKDPSGKFPEGGQTRDKAARGYFMVSPEKRGYELDSKRGL